jgi:hypothetical protein
MREEEQWQQSNSPIQPLGVSVVRSDPLFPYRCEFRHGPPRKQHFRQRFEQVCIDAASLLGTLPPMATPLFYWIDRLFEHCLGHDWKEFILALHSDSGGGSLERVCEASAAYCAWWDTHIITVTGKLDSDIDARTMAVIYALEQRRLEPITDEDSELFASLRESQEAVAAEPDPHSVQRSEPTADFPGRAEWARVKLRERGWDHNDPHRHSGPDRKTMLKILAGRRVKEETLDNLVTSLNRKKSRSGCLSFGRPKQLIPLPVPN